MRKESANGGQSMGEHLPSGWPTPSGACRAGKFHCPINRVLPSARSACSEQRLCEHLLPAKLTSSFACRTGRLYYPAIRVCPPQERVQKYFNERGGRCQAKGKWQKKLAGKEIPAKNKISRFSFPHCKRRCAISSSARPRHSMPGQPFRLWSSSRFGTGRTSALSAFSHRLSPYRPARPPPP